MNSVLLDTMYDSSVYKNPTLCVQFPLCILNFHCIYLQSPLYFTPFNIASIPPKYVTGYAGQSARPRKIKRNFYNSTWS